MAFSRVLGIGVYATVNLFIARGWAATANALQYDETIQRVVDGLPLTQRALNTAWQDLRTQLSNLSDGRYFAVNNGIHEFGGRGVGHAFAIIKQGGWGTAANNSERTGYNYGSTITNSSNISVWGPA